MPTNGNDVIYWGPGSGSLYIDGLGDSFDSNVYQPYQGSVGPTNGDMLRIEGALLLLFRYSWKKNWEAFLLVNVLTQGFLAVASVSVTAHSGVSAWYFFFFLLPAELIILLVELYLYAGCGLLTGHSKGRAAAYAITANLASAVLGYYLAEPVWRLVVSIL